MAHLVILTKFWAVLSFKQIAIYKKLLKLAFYKMAFRDKTAITKSCLSNTSLAFLTSQNSQKVPKVIFHQKVIEKANNQTPP